MSFKINFLIVGFLVLTSCGSSIEENTIGVKSKNGKERIKPVIVELNNHLEVISGTSDIISFLISRAYDSEKRPFPTKNISNLKLYGENGRNGFEWEFRNDPNQKVPTRVTKVLISEKTIDMLRETTLNGDIAEIDEIRLNNLSFNKDALIGSLEVTRKIGSQTFFTVKETFFKADFLKRGEISQHSEFETNSFEITFPRSKTESSLRIRRGLRYLFQEKCLLPLLAEATVEFDLPIKNGKGLGELFVSDDTIQLRFKSNKAQRDSRHCE